MVNSTTSGVTFGIGVTPDVVSNSIQQLFGCCRAVNAIRLVTGTKRFDNVLDDRFGTETLFRLRESDVATKVGIALTATFQNFLFHGCHTVERFDPCGLTTFAGLKGCLA